MRAESDSIYPDPGFWTKTSIIQLCYGILVNLTMVTIGLAFGFSAVLLPQLSVTEPKIPTSIAEESWIVSVLALATPFGCLVSGYLMDHFGRRKMLILCELPIAVGWILTGFAGTARDIIIGRIIVGLGCGMAMSTPRAYLTEISLPNMRGVIGSFPNIAMSLGITVQAGLSSVLRWRDLSFINGVYSIILFFISFVFPETPYFVLMKDTPEKAKEILKKFRSAKYNIDAEMEQLIDYKADNNIRRLSFWSQVKFLFRSSACKPFWIVTIYIIFAQLSGVTIILMWTEEILEESKSSVNAHTGNILLGVTRLCAGILTSILILKVKRRHLALISSLGVSAVCILLGTFNLYAKEPSILPQLCYVAFITFACLGYYVLPILIIFELSPLQIRGLLGSITISISNITIFSVNQCFRYVENAIGLANTILAFGASSFLGSIYIYFFLPETNDLTLQEIEEFYNERRSTLTSQRRIVSMQALSKASNSLASRSLMKVT
ncbi:unnamed protein product [Parnassius mnemosyne]|uniref:Major facilitator superfamily (MFS) profile domain-containing protein n=1 Tax=Parnassius mnemosyne TaxID=213953 RepID=A0AAV1MCK2_9NEOP